MIEGLTGPLSAGAASRDSTPRGLTGLNAMGLDFIGVHDRLAVRALVLDSGQGQVALVSVDLLEVGLTDELRARIEQRCGIPAAAILIVPTHSHNAPRAGITPAGGLSRAVSPQSRAYTEDVFDAIVDAVGDAQMALQPARVGLGVGAVDVNVNRDELVEGRWVIGVNTAGPSDKTVTVISVIAEDRTTIATIVGYAIHPTASLGSRELSADIAGAALAAISAEIGGTSFWLPGSLGDQNPRSGFRDGDEATESARRAAAFEAVDAQGSAIAAEAVRIAGAIDDWESETAVRASVQSLPCPPKLGVDLPPDMIQEAVDSVDLRLSVLTIGDIALLGVGGEVSTNGAEDILAGSAAAHPILVSMVNERLGYLADDEAFRRGSFTARGCPVQQGWLTRTTSQLAHMVNQLEGSE